MERPAAARRLARARRPPRRIAPTARRPTAPAPPGPRLRRGLALALALAGALAAAPATAAPAETHTLVARADAFASSRHPAASFGSGPALLVRGGARGSAVSYLRFDVPDPGGGRVVSASLRLYVREPSRTGGLVRRVRWDWSRSPTWSRRPAAGPVIGRIGPVRRAGRHHEVRLGPAGLRRGALTLAISSSSADAVRYGTIEGRRPARLVITIAPTAPTPSPGAPAPVSPSPRASEPTPPAPGPGTPAPAPPAAGSAGCGLPVTAGTSTRTIGVGGATRSYLEVVPGGLDPHTPVPVIMGFHGGNGTSAGANASMGLTSARPAIYVYPQAGPFADAWAGWNVDPAGADVPFVDTLLADLKGRRCVDERRVFAAGRSNGAFFANSLLCLRPGAFAAAASVAGGGPQHGCSQPRPFLGVHGRADTAVPVSTGRWSRSYWLSANGYAGAAPVPVSPAPCVSYPGTANPVVWCEHDGGHVWPSWAGAAVREFFLSL